MRERAAWLRQALSERDRAARARAEEAGAESVRAKHHDRLRDVLDQLLKAELAGETDEVRKLYKVGRSLLRKLGAHATPSEERQLSLTAHWLAAVSANGQDKGEKPAGAWEETVPWAPSEMVDRTTVAPKRTAIDHTILKRIARNQSTISLKDLAKQVGADSWLCVIALVEADEADRSKWPLLSALVTSPDGSAAPEFRAVLAGLGYKVPQTKRALHLVWQR
ncbi:hypothetical protein [Microbispora bryophytorum]|uniref:hypothetical protein n=1 Tax=Microbispora bryophytorum TaxID=1460882 RepID=UPI0033CF17A9